MVDLKVSGRHHCWGLLIIGGFCAWSNFFFLVADIGDGSNWANVVFPFVLAHDFLVGTDNAQTRSLNANLYHWGEYYWRNWMTWLIWRLPLVGWCASWQRLFLQAAWEVDCLHLLAVQIEAVLLQGSLTDCWHEWLMVAIWLSKFSWSICHDATNIASVKLHQVFEDLTCAQILLAMWPYFTIDQLFTLIN